MVKLNEKRTADVCASVKAAILAAGYSVDDCFVIGDFADVYRESEVPQASDYWECEHQYSYPVRIAVKEKIEKPAEPCTAVSYRGKHGVVNVTFTNADLSPSLGMFNGLWFPTMEYQADALHYHAANAYMTQHRTYGRILNKEQLGLLSMVERCVSLEKNLKAAKLLLEESLNDSQESTRRFFEECLKPKME